jgi:hypothetical protein
MKTSIQSLHFDADHKLIDFIEKKCEKNCTYRNFQGNFEKIKKNYFG